MIPLETAVLGLIASNAALAVLCFHLTRKPARRQPGLATRPGRGTQPAAAAEPGGEQDGGKP